MRVSVAGPGFEPLVDEFTTMPSGVRLPRRCRLTVGHPATDDADEDTEEQLPAGLDHLEVEIDFGDDGTSPVVSILEIRPTIGDSIRGEHLRYLASRWDRVLVPNLVRHCFVAAADSDGGPLGKGPHVAQGADVAMRGARARPTELTAAVLREVARVHGDAAHHATCDKPQCSGSVVTSPVMRVRRHFGTREQPMSRDGANTRIRRARDAGYLAPTKRGSGQAVSADRDAHSDKGVDR